VTLPGLDSLLTGKTTGNFVNSGRIIRRLLTVSYSFWVSCGPKRQSRPWVEQGIIRELLFDVIFITVTVCGIRARTASPIFQRCGEF
jgi:hypothetical protein